MKSICKHALSELHGRWMVLVIVYVSSVFVAGIIDLFRHVNHVNHLLSCQERRWTPMGTPGIFKICCCCTAPSPGKCC